MSSNSLTVFLSQGASQTDSQSVKHLHATGYLSHTIVRYSEQICLMLGRLIYSSTRSCTDDQIPEILEGARDFNARNEVSGALYLYGDTFVQYLEGDELVLNALYNRIQRDSRHKHCRLLDQRLVMLRIFQGWSMTWLVRTRETDHLIDLLLPHFTQSADVKGSLVGSLFQALSKVAEHQ